MNLVVDILYLFLVSEDQLLMSAEQVQPAPTFAGIW